MSQSKLGLFQGYGIELEYMIVDRKTLNVKPIADKILMDQATFEDNEVYFPHVSWSNELALHVIEFKSSHPQNNLIGHYQQFQEQVKKVNNLLEAYDACLMPSSMHPWMNPDKETKLWPHGNRIIYKTYDKLFGCGGHGWSNLQSMHINLAFDGSEEFFLLHEAIRLILPLIPAIAASSPYVEGGRGPALDTRLWYYKDNQRKIPSIIGQIIPERVRSIDEYYDLILNKMYQDIAPLDQDNILQHEWLNSRGAIARFERSAIEIRIIDLQECPLADLSLAWFIGEVLKKMVSYIKGKNDVSANVDSLKLKDLFLKVIVEGKKTEIADHNYLEFWREFLKKKEGEIFTVHALWVSLLNCISPEDNEGLKGYYQTAKKIIEHGCLSERILSFLGPSPTAGDLKTAYVKLSLCLNEGQLFEC